MEAALRSAYYLITKEDLADVNFQECRGLEGVKEAEIDIKGTKVRIAIAHQMGNVEAVLNKVREAKEKGEEDSVALHRSHGLPRRLHRWWRTAPRRNG